MLISKLKNLLKPDKYKEVIIKFLCISSLMFIFLNNLFYMTEKNIIFVLVSYSFLFLILLYIELSSFEFISIGVILFLMLWYSIAGGNFFFKTSINRFLLTACIGIVISKNLLNSYFFKVIFIVIAAIISFYMFILKADPQHILTSSRNYITINLLAYSLIIYFSEFVEDKKYFSLWPIIVTFFISLFVDGRAGMFFSFCCLSGVILVNFKRLYELRINSFFNKNRKYFYIFTPLTLVVFGFIFYFLYPEIMEWYVNSRFNSNGLVSNERFGMWKDFFKGLSLKRAVFGFDLGELKSVVAVNKEIKGHLNIHNSYLEIWANIGIFAFAVYFITILMLKKLFCKSKLLFWLMLMFLGLSAFHAVLFFRRFDFVFFTGLYLAFQIPEQKTILTFQRLKEYKTFFQSLKKRIM